MSIESLPIPGAYLIRNRIHLDARGSFENVYPGETLNSQLQEFKVSQVNISRNLLKGTIRGLHYQISEFPESKLVTCISGEIFDVILDLRPSSEFFGMWHSILLKPSSNSVLLPPGVAHGYQTMVDNSVIQYLHSAPYKPDGASGVRFDDEDLQINWPLELSNASEFDKNLPTFKKYKENS